MTHEERVSIFRGLTVCLYCLSHHFAVFGMIWQVTRSKRLIYIFLQSRVPDLTTNYNRHILQSLPLKPARLAKILC